ADGNNWTNNDNWKTGDNLPDWFGVHISNRRVDSLNLSSNVLTGTIPSFSGLELENLISLKLDNNELDSIADISTLTELSDLTLQNNFFQFDDLEPVVNIGGIVYTPQKAAFISEDITVFEGELISIDGTIGGSSNSYQWFKDNMAIVDATNPVLTITTAQFDDDATYRVEVTSSLVPGLVISSNDVIVRVSSLEKDIASLTQFYNETDGDNWTNNSGWLSDDITTWFGVQMNESQTRVVGVSLPENNLSGEVSSAITEVLNLDSLNISMNFITGIPDFTILSTFNKLNVANNQLQFADLESNIGITSFTYNGQTIASPDVTLGIARGENTTLSVEVEGSQNTYQWQLLIGDGMDISGADSSQLLLEDLAFEDIGSYICVISNDLVPGLSLRSTVTNLSVFTTIVGSVTGIGDTPITSG
ncbi:MAG: hypothetical protein AAFN93_28155, partial [Bacteroidota bacterium]